MTVTRLLARPLLASTFVVGGVNALRNAPALAQAAKPVADKLRPMVKRAAPQVSIPEDTVTIVRVNAAAQVLAGLALARGRAPRLSSAVLAASVLPTTVAGHQFWTESDPQTKADQRTEFFKHLSMLGALMLASVDTAGRPGVAWRAKNAATGARRQVKTLSREAKREAKLAAKSVKA